MEFTIEDSACPLKVAVIPAGPDCAIVIQGGTAPHVGCTVLAEPRPSLTGKGASATVSTLNRVGHKDDAVAAVVAKRVAAATGGAVSCSCGIHLDAAAPETIHHIQALAERVASEIIEKMTDDLGQMSPNK